MINLSYLTFSDSAKYADVARSITSGMGYLATFDFWNGNNTEVIKPVYPYIISVAFKLFGITDISVIFTSIFCFILSILVTYLLADKIFKNKIVSILSALSVGFNYNLIVYAFGGASESLFILEILVSIYLVSFKRNWLNYLSIFVLVLMFLTRPQAIIYIFAIVFYFFILNYQKKKAIIYSFLTILFGGFFYLLSNNQGIFALSQNLPNSSVSDSLRGTKFEIDLFVILKKVFYNLYNFYKAIPEIMNPYLFGMFTVGVLSFFTNATNDKDKIQDSFKLSTLFATALTFFITALTIPFYRYIHPVVPLVYIIAVATLVDLISKITKEKFIILSSTFIILFFAVGQTLGIIFLDSRFERKLKNTDKAPIFVLQGRMLKDITSKDDMILTNLDTWGSWYGERKTVWFPVEPEMIGQADRDIDFIYLTSYKMDDENYYMGDKWREIFNNPLKQTILPDYEFVGEYQFKADDNYEKESGRVVLLKRKK
ncbi:glycosyltransferase family 39 protein [Candidatus Dojkabacteria bacterium]|nr:glycosyltransferase family 39 protein [Candidatus Dojkabacteria bacterium]